MGCGECPCIHGKCYIDWEVTDPAGQPLDVVRGVRDEINRRVTLPAQELDEAQVAT